MIDMRNIGLALITGGSAIALVACGTAVNPAEAFVGTWDLISLVEENNTMSEDDIAMMRSLGLDVSLNFKEDGTFDLNLFGEAMSGTWQAKDMSTATATMDGNAVDITLVDGKLTLSQSGTKSSMTFTKKAPTSDSSSSSSDASVTDSSATSSADAQATSGSDASSSITATDATSADSTSSAK